MSIRSESPGLQSSKMSDDKPQWVGNDCDVANQNKPDKGYVLLIRCPLSISQSNHQSEVYSKKFPKFQGPTSAEVTRRIHSSEFFMLSELDNYQLASLATIKQRVS